jgi:hypothetical protein
MTTPTPLHTFLFTEDGDGYDLRRFLSPAVAAAHREGRLTDYCSTAGRVMRRLEVWPGGNVRLLPE